MKTYTHKALLVGLALLGLGMNAFHRTESQTPNVMNMTKAVKVISLSPAAAGPLRPEGRGYELVLRNVSAKNIDGYSIAFGVGAAVTSDLTSAFRLIAPGDQFTELLPEAINIVIRHVTFEDASSDGDAVAAAELQDRREGMREQLERIAPLLNAAAASGDVEQLKAQLQALPEETVSGRSVYVAAGMRNVREDTLLSLERLDKSNIRVGLGKVAEQNNKRIMRLSRRVNR